MAVSTHVTRYEGPSEYRAHGTLVYLFDAGTGEIIAELTAEAAAEVRQRHLVNLAFDGHGHVGKATPCPTP